MREGTGVVIVTDPDFACAGLTIAVFVAASCDGDCLTLVGDAACVRGADVIVITFVIIAAAIGHFSESAVIVCVARGCLTGIGVVGAFCGGFAAVVQSWPSSHSASPTQ